MAVVGSMVRHGRGHSGRQFATGVPAAERCLPLDRTLRALGWNPLAPARSGLSCEPLGTGARLDAKSAASRHLYTSIAPAGMDAERLVSLQWSALDAANQQAVMQGTATGVSGPDRLAWLRGDLGNTALRPRETRMANARGARVLVVPPPVWQPGKAGHGAFRERYRTRPHMVWLGTTDALLHGFSAVTGEESSATCRAPCCPRQQS
ncbi:hypothetical protein AWV80_20565 [Cupriavidus sp. UYMU48A]|nr:hypothetical protein AWV80_20565 [Cupriavidus sp. UYMU48A]